MSPTRSGLALLVLSVCAIAVVTLTPGEGITGSTLCLFCGDRGVADFLSNVLLFVPFGVAVALLTGSTLAALAAGVLFSLGIETAQVTAVFGRDANVGDLVANSLGAMLGWGLCRTRAAWFVTYGASRRVLFVTSVTLGVVLVGLSLLTPSFPKRPYYLQWTARFDRMQHYDGRVLSTQIGGLRLQGPWRIDASDRVREMLSAGARLEFVALAGNTPAGTAPIVSIYDDLKREIVLIGADGTDLVYRYRTRAEEFLLDRGEVRIAGALRGVSPGAPLKVAVAKQRNGYCVEVNSTVMCEVGFTVADTWTLLAPGPLGRWIDRVIGLLWLVCIFLPSGLLVGTKRSAILTASAVAIALMGGPYAMGFAPTPVHQLAAALAGVGIGTLTRVWVFRRKGTADFAGTVQSGSALQATSH